MHLHSTNDGTRYLRLSYMPYFTFVTFQLKYQMPSIKKVSVSIIWELLGEKAKSTYKDLQK